MPYLDANAVLRHFRADAIDHVVVGAGAAGILLALKLAERGRRVVLVESGHFEHDESRQALNEVEETGKPFGNARWTRKRALGGTTIAWGGQSLRFSDLDFRPRDWVWASGWPIGLADLEPYYRAANHFMGIEEPDWSSANDRLLGNPAERFDADLIEHLYALWAPQPNFLKLHRRALEAKVVVLYNAHLTRIDLGPQSAVDRIELSNFAGHRRALPVRSVVLAPGGIEAVRLLLLNRHQLPAGLGNAGGWLGKAFMEHPSTVIGTVATPDLQRLQTWLGNRWRRRGRMSFRMCASPAWQARHRMLNVAGAITWLYPGQEGGPLSSLRAFARHRDPAMLRAILRGLPQIASGAASILRNGVIYKPGAIGQVGLTLEQPPSESSFIGLGRATDMFGQPVARIHWSLAQECWRTACAFARVIQGELARLRLGELVLLPHLDPQTPDWERHLSEVNHHMGGARMSARASEGVVDPHLQVWGATNLHVCSSAVFPTGSHSNPTLTILALAARLADRLVPAGTGRPGA